MTGDKAQTRIALERRDIYFTEQNKKNISEEEAAMCIGELLDWFVYTPLVQELCPQGNVMHIGHQVRVFLNAHDVVDISYIIDLLWRDTMLRQGLQTLYTTTDVERMYGHYKRTDIAALVEGHIAEQCAQLKSRVHYAYHRSNSNYLHLVFDQPEPSKVGMWLYHQLGIESPRLTKIAAYKRGSYYDANGEHLHDSVKFVDKNFEHDIRTHYFKRKLNLLIGNDD